MLNLNTNLRLFLSKFFRYATFGISVLVLLFASSNGVFGNSWERGPQVASAQQVGYCEDGWRYLGEDAGDDNSWILDPSCYSNSYTQGGNQNQEQEQYYQPQPYQPAPTCTDNFLYNQCIDCNISEPVYQDSCYGTYTTGAAQYDAACSWACPAEPAPPAPTPECYDNAYYCDPNTGTYIDKTGGYWDGYQCVYAFNNTYVSCIEQPYQPAPLPTPFCEDNSQYCNYTTGTYFQNYGYVNGYQCSYGSYNTYISCISEPFPPIFPPIYPPQPPVYPPPPPFFPPQPPFNPLPPVQPPPPIYPIVPVPSQPPVITYIPPQSPAPFGQAPIDIVNNNNNTNNNYNNNSLYQTQSQSVNVPPAQVITVAAPQPVSQVAGLSYIKQLPSTGLPLAAWAAASFIPVGLKFRRFAKGKLEDGMTANYIWEDKQFKLGD